VDDIVIFESVLGFNLKADIRDANGNLIKPGVKSSVIPKELPIRISTKITDRSFFTHFNDELLSKIRQHRRLTD
jgi:hypothetical protein